MWNSLDLNIRNITSFSALKRKVLKDHASKPVLSFYFSGVDLILLFMHE